MCIHQDQSLENLSEDGVGNGGKSLENRMSEEAGGDEGNFPDVLLPTARNWLFYVTFYRPED